MFRIMDGCFSYSGSGITCYKNSLLATAAPCNFKGPFWVSDNTHNSSVSVVSVIVNYHDDQLYIIYIRFPDMEYRHIAFVTHEGRTPYSGHYLCHIKHGEQWFLYNDSMVCKDDMPKPQYGYFHLYARCDNTDRPCSENT